MDDRASFGGSFGLLFSVVVVLSAITASVSIPDEAVSDTRPQAQVEAMGAGMGSEFDETTRELLAQEETNHDDDLEDEHQGKHDRLSTIWIDGRSGSSRGQARLAGDGVRIPPHAWNRIPEANRERIRSRLGTFVQQVQLQQARDGEVTRVEAAGDGIVAGAHLKQGGGQHTVQVRVVEPYTEELEVVDHYTPLLDHYLSRWSFDRPGEGWERTGDSEEIVVDRQTAWSAARPGAGWELLGPERETVIDRQYRWAVANPGPQWSPTGQRQRVLVDTDRRWASTAPARGWERTGNTRVYTIDTRYRSSASKPGPGWQRLERVGRELTRTGTDDQYYWSTSRSGPGVYGHLPGYTYAGIEDTEQIRVGTDRSHQWSASRSDRSLFMLLRGYRYAGIVDTRDVQTGTESTWVWQDQPAPGPAWRKVAVKRARRGYQRTVSPSPPDGEDWELTGIDHVETKEVVSYKDKWLIGWYTVDQWINHIHYKTDRKWVPGRTEWVEKKTWVKGRYKPVTERKWVGWKTKTRKKWVSGHWKRYTTKKKVTRTEKDCTWRWSWWRGPYKSCSTKTVTDWKKVTKKKWVRGHWKRTTERVWVGWRTVRTKRWVSGHYETKTVRKEIPGYWKQEKVKVGVHAHKVPKTIWGPHKERVKVTSEKTILQYGWRKPIYDLKVQYDRPTFETQYRHRYEKPRYESRYKHHFTRPVYDWQPVFRWQKDLTRRQHEYERRAYDWRHRFVNEVTETEYRWQKEDTRTKHRWQKPVYRNEPVTKTVVVWKERTKTVEHDVETAPFVYDDATDWTVATAVTETRDSSLLVERALLTEDDAEALQLVATSQTDGSRWTLTVWRDGDEIVLRTNRGVEERVRARFARVDFDAGTVNGEDVDIALAGGVSSPYTLSFRNGDQARGTFDFTIVGRPAIAGQPVNLEADEPAITVVDGIVYSATFDVTVETDATTYTDRITVEPSTTLDTDDEA